MTTVESVIDLYRQDPRPADQATVSEALLQAEPLAHMPQQDASRLAGSLSALIVENAALHHAKCQMGQMGTVTRVYDSSGDVRSSRRSGITCLEVDSRLAISLLPGASAAHAGVGDRVIWRALATGVIVVEALFGPDLAGAIPGTLVREFPSSLPGQALVHVDLKVGGRRSVIALASTGLLGAISSGAVGPGGRVWCVTDGHCIAYADPHIEEKSRASRMVLSASALAGGSTE